MNNLIGNALLSTVNQTEGESLKNNPPAKTPQKDKLLKKSNKH